MLYLLGLSYGAVSLALESLGVPLSKTQVYQTVQAVAARIPDLKRDQVFQGLKTKALGGDLTSVKCAGHWLHLGLSVDALTGLVLTIDELTTEDAKALQAWIDPIAKSVGAEVLVTDDADGFKTVADEGGRLHQVCKSHVKRKSEDLIDEMRPQVAADQDGSLKAIGGEPAQALADRDRIARTDHESTTRAGTRTRADASALCGSLASKERDGGQSSLSAASVVSGSLEPVEPPDTLSQMAGS